MPRPRPLRAASVLLALALPATTAACGAGDQAAPLATWLAQRTLYVAHEGGDGNWPEGTPLAYREAIRWNPRLALDVPVWRTADGVWVVSHDRRTGRVFDEDLDIPSTTWARLALLRSRRGGQPLALLKEDVLDVAPRDRVLFVDDKADSDVGPLLDLLDRYGGASRTVLKGYWRDVQVPDAARARGYQTWGYYYSNQLADFAATQSRWTLLGLDWSAPASQFAVLRATGKRVLAHVVAAPAQANAALAKGATGVMVSDVAGVVPH